MGTMSDSFSHVINLEVHVSLPQNAWSKLCIRVVPLVGGFRACTIACCRCWSLFSSHPIVVFGNECRF